MMLSIITCLHCEIQLRSLQSNYTNSGIVRRKPEKKNRNSKQTFFPAIVVPEENRVLKKISVSVHVSHVCSLHNQ